MKKSTTPYVLGTLIASMSIQANADILWTYNSDIDKTPHYLRVNRIIETSPPDEEIRGYEIDGRYGLSDNFGFLLRHSFGSGDSAEGGQITELDRKIYDIGFSYGDLINDDLFYEVKAVYNHGSSTAQTSTQKQKQSAYSFRVTPRIRYDINDYLQTRALIEFEKPHNADLGSEAAVYLTLIPTQELALDVKFGKGITSTNHSDRKWVNDAWYVEPRLTYRINDSVSLEAAYRDKEKGGQIVDFGFVVFF